MPAQEHAESILETIREPLLVLAADLKVITASRSFYEMFHVTPEETEGRFVYSIGDHAWDIPALRELLEKIVPKNTHFNDYEVEHEFPTIGLKTMLLNARRIYRESEGTDRILLALEDITDRKRSEEALKISETRYRRLFETAQDGVLLVDADTGQISDVNPFLIQMLGYSHEDFLGRELWKIGAFKDIEASRAAFSELQTKGYVRYEDLPLQTRDGRHIDVEFVSNVYRVDHKKVIQCNIRDITTRKKAEEKLRAREGRYRSYIELTGQLAWTTNTDGEVVEDIPAWRKFTGQTEEETKGAGWVKALHPDDVKHTMEAWNKAVAAKSAYEVEYRIRRHDGGYRQFWVHGVPVIMEDGSIVEWVGTCVDITERKKMEEDLRQSRHELEIKVQERTAELAKTNQALQAEIEERKQTEEALRQSEMKYRIVADNTYDWEWWRDPERNFIYASPSCKTITHHDPDAFIRDPDLLLKIIHPDDKPSFNRHQIEVEEKHTSGEIEFRILRPDGSVRWLAHACQPVFDEEGRFLGRRGSNRDITTRKEAEKLLRESEDRYRTLVETMNDGLGVADEKEVWTYVNDGFCKTLGYACDEIIGRHVHEWLDEANRKILAEQGIKRRRGEQEPYEIAWTRKDGSIVYTLVSPKPILGESGQFQGSFAVITDITDRKKAEDSLRNALSEIKTLKDRLEAENIYFRQEIKMNHHFDDIIGQSNAFKYVLYRAEQVAPTNATVLILGETGTGKELVAAAIHQMSPRRDRPLITVNCAALPANLIESELFGREKGAFTGADARQIGRFEVAHGSSLCLDEIGELPLELQAKLLRVIEHNEFQRLGSSHTINVDVRIVATTNRNLEEEVRKGRFRQDLYYRLNGFPLTIPPLRQRKEDIPLLVQAFVERYAKKLGKQFASIQKDTMKALQDYPWPGNIRELENVIERAVILCPGPVFQLADKLESPSSPLSSTVRTLEETERDQILKALSETRWRINGKRGAAGILGLHPSTLRARMHKLGILRPGTKASD